MKLALASAALLGLTLAPAAYAQITCSEVNRLIAEAADDFEDISGEEVDDYLFEATYNIAGATECMIDLDWDSIYSCEWQYASYSDATAALSSQTAALGYCLAGWKAPKGIQVQSSADSDGYRSIAGSTWEGTGNNVDLEWTAELEEHADSNGTHYHLWVELIYWF